MRIFDAQLRSDTRGEADLKNLAYFGTSHVVSTMNDLPSQTSEQLLERATSFVASESTRLTHAGLVGALAIGVLPTARPKRAHPELWAGLKGVLEGPGIVAVGEIGVWEDLEGQWELFFHQVSLALDLGLPMVVSPPRELHINMTYKMMLRLERAGVEPSRVVFNHIDHRTVEAVLADGFWGSVTVGPRYCTPDEAASVVQRAGSDAQLMLNTSLSDGPVDVLSLPKTVEVLISRGMSQEPLDRIAYKNAARFYGIYQPAESESPDTHP